MFAHRFLVGTMNRDMRRGVVWAVIVAFAIMIVVPLYFYFDPAHSHLAPKCMFHALTGLDCPACGGQRALHSLLNGEVWLSIRYNPFLWLCTPYIFLLLYASIFRGERTQRLYDRLTSKRVVMCYLVLYVVWWVVRNLPLWHTLVDLPK